MVRLLRIPLHRMRKVWLKKYSNIALVDTQPAFEDFKARYGDLLPGDPRTLDEQPTGRLRAARPDSCGRQPSIAESWRIARARFDMSSSP